jgi:hypothetical protein
MPGSKGNWPVEVVRAAITFQGASPAPMTTAIVISADGAAVDLGVSLAQPRASGARNPSASTFGVRNATDHRRHHMDHRRIRKGNPHAYAGSRVKMASWQQHRGRPGGGRFLGPLGNETRAWLDHLATGAPIVHDAGASLHQSGNNHRHRARGVRPTGPPAVAGGGLIVIGASTHVHAT